MKKCLIKIEDIICTIIKVIVAIIVIGMVGINVLQVITRYFIDYIITWIEDVSILGVLWIATLGVAYAWFKGDHLIMDITDSFYPDKLKKILWIVCQIIVIPCGIKLCELGVYNAKLNFGVKATGLQYDESFRYYPLIVCGALLAIAAIITLGKEWATYMEKKKSGGEAK